MARRKKSASAATEDTSCAVSDVLTEDYSTNQSINQGFMDLVEVDPVEPPNPKDVKGKYWCFVLYPDSAPPDWREILNSSGLAWAMSPLHAFDLNADGGKKKGHYHVIIIWQATTTYKAVKSFTQGKLCGTVPQVLHSPLGYYRYFTHKDNPEKYQYDERDIESGNGFDIADYAKMTKKQRVEMHYAISQMIMDNNIDNYRDAVAMCMALGFDEYEMITSHTMHFSGLCKSIGYKLQMEARDYR